MECTDCKPSEKHIRQGDVLAAHPNTSRWANRWGRFYIVLSADCDIARRKTDTGLVVVPVVGLRTYTLDLWFPSQLEKILSLGVEKLEPMLNRFSGKRLLVPAVLSLTPEQLAADLTARKGADKELGGIADRVCLFHQTMIELLSLKSAALSSTMGLNQVIKFYELKKNITGKDGDPRSDLINALNALNDPRRSDTWPLCDIIGLDGDMREDENDGFVAYLRRFCTLSPENTYTDKAQWLKDQDGYYRVCRLKGVYKSDLVQKFANLFSRVGLDDEREDEHKRIAERAATRFLKEVQA